MLERIDAAIETGRYRNRPDYIMAALRLMEEVGERPDVIPSMKSTGRV